MKACPGPLLRALGRAFVRVPWRGFERWGVRTVIA